MDEGIFIINKLSSFIHLSKRKVILFFVTKYAGDQNTTKHII